MLVSLNTTNITTTVIKTFNTAVVTSVDFLVLKVRPVGRGGRMLILANTPDSNTTNTLPNTVKISNTAEVMGVGFTM